MVLTILFIVFFMLWLVSLLPAAGTTRFGPYVGLLPWVCVGLLALRIGVFSTLH